MSWRTPEPRTLEVRAIRSRERTRNGNWYLPCETSDGVALFWGSDKNLDNIQLIEAGRVPFTVTCGCIASNWPQYDLWVPENSNIEVHAPDDSGESEDNSVPAAEQGPLLLLSLHEGSIDAEVAQSWMEAMELVEPRLRGLVRTLFRRRVPIPVVGYELTRGTGAVVAESELAWPERMVADVHILLWADKHDDAYEWAKRHRCDINPETGAIQVYEPESGAPAEPHYTHDEHSADAGQPLHPADEFKVLTSAFQDLKDRQLTQLGVPTAMLAEVREIRDETGLDAMQARLPVEAYEALFLYLAGETYEQLVAHRKALEHVDTNDFASALNRAESRARFVVAEDDLALEAMLNAPLEHWRVFLHPTQRRLVERHWNGPARVLGGAGTGKTVAAMHRARWLARNLPEGGILVTTFARNLATDIENNLRSICSPDEMSRIEVTNLDRWVVRFLRGKRYEFQVAFGRNREAWQRALDLKPPELGLSDSFCEDEWEQVIQAKGVANEQEYRHVSRVGRGTRLGRGARVRVWPVFEEYRAQLAERGLKEVDDAYRDAAALLRNNGVGSGYVAVVVDEAQDMGAQAFLLIRAITPAGRDDLFIAGDGHQRIYGRNRVVMGRCDIDIRGRSRKLRLNYRTTEETRRWASHLLAGRDIDDLDGGSDDNKGIWSLTRGPEPMLKRFDTREEQNTFVVSYLTTLQAGGDAMRAVCNVARTTGERDAIRQHLQAQDIEVEVIERDMIDDAAQAGVRLATMHRVKGLEFERVVMASMNEGLVPLSRGHRR